MKIHVYTEALGSSALGLDQVAAGIHAGELDPDTTSAWVAGMGEEWKSLRLVLELYVLPDRDTPPYTISELLAIGQTRSEIGSDEEADKEVEGESQETASVADEATNDVGQLYKHSGKLPLGSLVSAIPVLLACSVILGTLCAYIQFYAFDIIVSAGGVLVLGIALGYVVKIITRFGHIRNRVLVLLLSIVAALFTKYVVWVNWLYIYFEFQQFNINPVELYYQALAVSEQEPWHVMYFDGFIRWTPGSLELRILWSLEAVFLLLVTMVNSLLGFKNQPYCETCKCWLTKDETIPPLEDWIYTGLLAHELKSGDFSSLKALQPHQSGQSSTCLTVYYCSHCDQENYLSVESHLVNYDKDGDPYVKKTKVIPLLRIPAKITDELLGHWIR